jgi:hypothetical protein
VTSIGRAVIRPPVGVGRRNRIPGWGSVLPLDGPPKRRVQKSGRPHALTQIQDCGTAVPRHSFWRGVGAAMSIVGEIGLALVILLFALGAVWFMLFMT